MNTMGPRVIGEEAYKAAQLADTQAAKDGAMGPRVLGTGKWAPVEEAAVAVEETRPGLSAMQVKLMLSENPALVDTLLGKELDRPEGPRTTVLRFLRSAEFRKMEGARDAVLAQIDALLDLQAPVGAED